MRLTQKDLQTKLDILNNLTGIEFKDVQFNGFHHIMFKDGEMLFAGSLREVYDMTHAFMQGLTFRERYEVK